MRLTITNISRKDAFALFPTIVFDWDRTWCDFEITAFWMFFGVEFQWYKENDY